MTNIADLSYFEIEIDKFGNLIDPQPVSSLPLAGKRDLFVMAHGWNSDMDSARDLYRNFFTQFSRTFGKYGAPGVTSGQCAVMGILWPSEKYADAALIPGGAAGIVSSAEKLLRDTTYHLMKDRAGIVGRGGVASTLGQIQIAFPGIRIHLAGHSFGCRVVASTAAAIVKPVASMTLFQAAFSHNSFSPDYGSTHRPGGFRDVVSGRKCEGPMLITHSVNDEALGLYYPIASRIFGQNSSSLGCAKLGDANDLYGALGRNGARYTPEASDGDLLAEGARYSFAPGRIFNLRADRIIQAHADIVKPETTWALIAAAGLDASRDARNDTIVRVTNSDRPVATQAPSDQNAAVFAGFLGWTLDAFDYFLVIYCLTAIGRDFHKSDAEMTLAITATLVFRPVGAFLFGLLADRYGRRLPLMIDLIFYSVVEVATAFAPGYKSFLILRALFGIGMGGEWGVGASLTMEKVSPRFRGLVSGILQQGYALGNLLAALCFFFLFNRWGWRPMFFIGGLPALLAVFVRMRVKESEVWEKTRTHDWGQLRHSILSNWKLFLYLTLLMTFMNFSSHGTQDLYPTFLQRYWHFDASKRSAISVVAGLGAICGGTLFGYYSDLKGRRRAIVTALLLGVVVIPLWALSPTTALLVAGAFLMQFMVQGAWGVIPAHLSELSPDAVRGFLPGFSYQCGVLISSSIVYIQALFAEHFSYAATMALSTCVVFIGGSIVAGLGRERRGMVFGKTPS